MPTDSRNTYAIIDRQAYAHNIRFFQTHCQPAKVMPVIKADGYGHGALPLAYTAQDLDVPFLGVAFLEEALTLKKNGIHLPILVLNYFRPDQVEIACENEFRITLYANEQWEQIRPFLTGDRLLIVHVKVDTGMGRLGQNPVDTDRFLEKLSQHRHVRVEGLYTHFATADDCDHTYQKEQYQRFLSLIERWKERIPYIHMANSAAAWNHATPLMNMVRLGIASYGLDPANVKRHDALEPVLSWHTCLSYVKTVEAGTSISYGQTFVAANTMRVGTIPVGYADGYNRLLSNCGTVLVHGKRCSVIGRVCMDQIMVDLSEVQGAKMGDSVVLIGRMGQEEITAEEIAQKIRTINYEVTCAISKRVPRIDRCNATIGKGR